MANTFQEARGVIENDRDLIIARDKAGNLERAYVLLHADTYVWWSVKNLMMFG